MYKKKFLLKNVTVKWGYARKLIYHVFFSANENSLTQDNCSASDTSIIMTNSYQFFNHLIFLYTLKWAASWQNQQCGCAPSKDSDQPGHPPSLIRVFTVHMKKAWVLSYPLSAQRLRWAHMPFCWFCHEVAHFAQPSVEENRALKWIWWWWLKSWGVLYVRQFDGWNQSDAMQNSHENWKMALIAQRLY